MVSSKMENQFGMEQTKTFKVFQSSSNYFLRIPKKKINSSSKDLQKFKNTK